MSFKVIYGIIHSKTCQLLRKFVLYILNTPGKLLENELKKSWKTLDFLNYDSIRVCVQSYLTPRAWDQANHPCPLRAILNSSRAMSVVSLAF